MDDSKRYQDDLKKINIEAGRSICEYTYNLKETAKRLDFEKRVAEERALTSAIKENSPVQTSNNYGSAPSGTYKALKLQDQIDDVNSVIRKIEGVIESLEDQDQAIIKAYCDGFTLNEYARQNHLLKSKSREIKYKSDRALTRLWIVIQNAGIF